MTEFKPAPIVEPPPPPDPMLDVSRKAPVLAVSKRDYYHRARLRLQPAASRSRVNSMTKANSSAVSNRRSSKGCALAFPGSRLRRAAGDRDTLDVGDGHAVRSTGVCVMCDPARCTRCERPRGVTRTRHAGDRGIPRRLKARPGAPARTMEPGPVTERRRCRSCLPGDRSARPRRCGWRSR